MKPLSLSRLLFDTSLLASRMLELVFHDFGPSPLGQLTSFSDLSYSPPLTPEQGYFHGIGGLFGLIVEVSIFPRQFGDEPCLSFKRKVSILLFVLTAAMYNQVVECLGMRFLFPSA